MVVLGEGGPFLMSEVPSSATRNLGKDSGTHRDRSPMFSGVAARVPHPRQRPLPSSKSETATDQVRDRQRYHPRAARLWGKGKGGETNRERSPILHRLLYNSTLGSSVIKKKKKMTDARRRGSPCSPSETATATVLGRAARTPIASESLVQGCRFSD